MRREDLLRQHKAEAVVVTCMDFRFCDQLRSAIKEAFNISAYDTIRLAGGAKNLSSPDADYRREVVLSDIATACKLHDVKLVMLLNHEQCGAYAQAGHQFVDAQAESDFHAGELGKARTVVSESFPTTAVASGLLLYNEDGTLGIHDIVRS